MMIINIEMLFFFFFFKALVPGTPLEPLESDSKIPILLAQRGEKNYITSTNKQS